MFLRAMGGNRPWFFLTVLLGSLFLTNAALNLQTWFLGYWASQYNAHPAHEVAVFLCVSITFLRSFSDIIEPSYLGVYCSCDQFLGLFESSDISLFLHPAVRLYSPLHINVLLQL